MKRRITSIVLALSMIFTLLIGAAANVAAEEVQPTKTTKLHVHKYIFDTKDKLDKWTNPEGYDGTQDKTWFEGKMTAAGVDYKPAPNIYFALMNKDQTKFIKTDGSETTDATWEEGVIGGLTNEDGMVTLDTTNVKDGTYKVVELREKSTYVGPNGEYITKISAPIEIQLPYILNDGVKGEVNLYPKNLQDKPTTVKNFKENISKFKDMSPSKEEDLQQKEVSMGDVVDYTVKTIVPAEADYETFHYEDKMTIGLDYNKGSLTVNIVTDEDQNQMTPLAAGTDYILTEHGYGFEIDFTAAGLAKVCKQDHDVNVRIDYKATVNGQAKIDKPELNDVQFIYGREGNFTNTPKEPKTKVKKLTVNKTWNTDGNTTAPAGAKVEYSLIKVDPVTGTERIVEKVKRDTDTGFNYTWENLDENASYTVAEKVSGYKPEYTWTEVNEKGEVVMKIKNVATPQNKTIDPKEPEVITHGKKFVKMEKDGTARLEGAQFVIKNAEGKFLKAKKADDKLAAQKAYEAAEKAYLDAINAYNVETDQAQKPALKKIADEKERARDIAFFQANDGWDWTETQDEALVLTSAAGGQFEIRGLKKGTYTLVETKAPENYAAPTNPETQFEVKQGSYTTDDVQVNFGNQTDGAADAKRIDNTKYTIPQTGGIGTVIFTVVGLAIMATAAFALKKKRTNR